MDPRKDEEGRRTRSETDMEMRPTNLDVSFLCAPFSRTNRWRTSDAIILFCALSMGLSRVTLLRVEAPIVAMDSTRSSLLDLPSTPTLLR